MGEMHVRNRLDAVVLAATTAALIAPLSVRAGDFDFTIQPILADGEWNNPTSIAVDEDGITHMAYMTQHHTDSATKEIWYATDSGGGGSWTFTQITDNTVREEFPHLALDSSGNVHIAFHTGTATSNMIRYVNNVGVPPNSPPGTFNSIIDITGSGFKIVKHAVDGTGNVHFTFTSQTTNATDEVFYTTWDATSGVGPLINLSQSPGSEGGNDIAIDSNGDVHVVFQDGAISGPLVYRHNIGGTWTTVSTGVTSTSVRDPIILIGPGNVVNIVHRISDLLHVIDDGGTGVFGPATTVYNGSYRPSFYNRFAIDDQGHRFIAFASNVGDLRGIVFIGETEAGFAPPIQLSTTMSGNQGTSVALNSAGKLVVSYSLSGSNPKTGFVFANISLATHAPAAPCPADIAPPPDGDTFVNVNDLLLVVGNWGAVGANPADVNGDNVVNVNDLLAVVGAWGACP